MRQPLGVEFVDGVVDGAIWSSCHPDTRGFFHRGYRKRLCISDRALPFFIRWIIF